MFNGQAETIKSLLTKDYSVNLLIGAGFSAGATNRNGSPVPHTNGKLIDLLIQVLTRTDVTIEERERTDVKALARLLDEELSAKRVAEFYDGNFTVTDFPDYFKNLTKIKWRAIYTLNFDDLIEKIYDKQGKKDQIKVYQYHYKEKMNAFETGSSTPIIHLHGSVPVNITLEPFFRKNLIITREEYGDNPNNYYWEEFVREYLRVPTIIVGASFAEQTFDIIYGEIKKALNNAQPILPGRTGVIITPDSANHEQESYKMYHNLTHIKAKGEDFLNWIAGNIPDEAAIEMDKEKAIKPCQFKILDQPFWDSIKSEPKEEKELLHYYTSVNKGQLPWVIEQGWYFPPNESVKYPVTDEYSDNYELLGIKETVRKALAQNSLSILQITGMGGDGKSSLLWWMARDLHSEYNIISYSSLSNFILPDFTDKRPVVILIDEAAQIYNSEYRDIFYTSICEYAKKVPVLVVTTGRESQKPKRDFSEGSEDVYQNRYFLKYRSESQQAERLLQKIYDSFIKESTESTEILSSILAEPRLSILEKALTLLVRLDKGKKIKESFSFDWVDFSKQIGGEDGDVKNLYFLVASFFRYNLKMPHTFSLKNWLSEKTYAGFEFSKAIAAINDFSKPVLQDERGFLTLRHQLLAKWYFEVNESEARRHQLFWNQLVDHFKKDLLNDNDTFILRNLYTSEDFRNSEWAQQISINDIITILERHLNTKEEWNEIELSKCVLDIVNLYHRVSADYSKCEAILLRALGEKKCTNGRLYIKLGNTYLYWAMQLEHAGLKDKAELYYDKSIETFKRYLESEGVDKEFARRGLSKVYLKRSTKIEDRISLIGDQTPALYKLSKELTQQEDFENAEKCLTKLLYLEREKPQFSTMLLGGKLYVELFDYEKAQDFFLKAAAINEYLEAPLLEMAMLHRRMCEENYSEEFTEQSVIDEFRNLYEKFGSDSIHVRTETAKTYIGFNVNLEEAEKILKKNMEITSENLNHMPTIFQLAILYQKDKNTIDKAVAICDYAIGNADDEELRRINIVKAKSLIKRNLDGDLVTAEEILKGCFGDSGKKVDIIPILAIIELCFIRKDPIAKINTKVSGYISNLKITSARFYVHCSKIYAEHSHFKEALHVIDKGIRIADSNEKLLAQRSRLVYQRIVILTKAGRALENSMDLAFEELKKLYLQDTEKANIRIYISFLYYYAKLEKLRAIKLELAGKVLECRNYAVLKVYKIDGNNTFAIGHLINMLAQTLKRPRLSVFWGSNRIEYLKRKKYNVEYLYKELAGAAVIYGDKNLYEKIRTIYPYRTLEFRDKAGMTIINHTERGKYDPVNNEIVLDKGRRARLKQGFPFPLALLGKKIYCTTYMEDGKLLAYYIEEYFNPYPKRVEEIIDHLYIQAEGKFKLTGWVRG